MSYGRYFDELRTGDEFKHWPGRTINEFDDTLLSLLSMNQHPIHLDEHFALFGHQKAFFQTASFGINPMRVLGMPPVFPTPEELWNFRLDTFAIG